MEVACYARVSTSHQQHEGTIESQHLQNSQPVMPYRQQTLPFRALGKNSPQQTCVGHAHVVSSPVRSLVEGTTRSEEGHYDGSGPEKL